jgi:hypothetical protein
MGRGATLFVLGLAVGKEPAVRRAGNLQSFKADCLGAWLLMCRGANEVEHRTPEDRTLVSIARWGID